ncbi:putative DnaJ domain, Chaperone J-domain superfamily [Helianthus annuus]|uniref:DnaJ domain, Chaperone J-domain superfamily n=1 Tax=Helianthus annuus TaxID=4232 RepID=A0A251S3W0_HELAN|nr:chaperone protein dnaJ 11, chloroplastic [Helianthus annuus]KAF5762427.1 putative DnaJ domain, Chaperone J-domain superfamily [Helianthus annuus]KAJ0462542.1 putative DnaJ domain, Chaperone J-domain superfamily [Helianthus annuus]KAJ0642940.1 putative DnaJ domain, Chaperone J-domain superfamily [Helianthus annuus]KAJ0838283.1 putative DnaJ domain, Chaperone J-domain superfamily [Helianthus annuus]
MFSPVSNPNSLRLRQPPPPPLHSTPGALPSPTSPNIRNSPRTSPISATAYSTGDTTCYAPSPTAVMSPPSSLYGILGISMEATGSEIKTAYRRLARTSHPDVNDSSGEEFMKIHAAYSTLSDPDKRADYDRRIFRTSRSRSYSSVSGFNGYSGRKWETDQCW